MQTTAVFKFLFGCGLLICSVVIQPMAQDGPVEGVEALQFLPDVPTSDSDVETAFGLLGAVLFCAAIGLFLAADNDLKRCPRCGRIPRHSDDGDRCGCRT